MNYTEIIFTINTLDGKTFPISISSRDAQNVYGGSKNQYNKYGLDVLKEAISKHTGNGPVIQQLITEDKELTISDPLIQLEITLMLKPSFYINFLLPYIKQEYPLYSDIDFLQDRTAYTLESSTWESIICYLGNYITSSEGVGDGYIPQIKVLGEYRDYFKIATKDLPLDYLRDPNLWVDKKYIINDETPEYIWLRYNKNNMEIVLDN
jgi:hypothetical protein